MLLTVRSALKVQLYQFFKLIVGASIIGYVVNAGLVPHKLFVGGLPAATVVLSELSNFVADHLGLTTFVIALILALIQGLVMGFKSSIKSAIGTVAMSLAISAASYLKPAPISDSMWIALPLSAILLGLSVHLILDSGNSIIGTVSLAQMIHYFTKAPIPLGMLLCDGLIIACGGILLGWTQALVSLLGILLLVGTLRLVQGSQG
ncbi:YitT family protein [Pseudobacteriovorax antillogorgiicola]|uniref:Uncharacterized 5xTM membrane BCR, YitT family COG1284 n=1 Tax=Pseudobacteriovorax antillogorgiicola TaxID=1513793 RepID=A0A1Y6CCE1_9BACT|nr:YitT family protein [Pseudobacteriovorax antillogorgiicola]TCS49366.1 putative 5xTM membrane YitT family protein [Pseudobacteriovorax antillogorgiicola]SMF47474.1 Uncharacterised 5xTM membrane BCR, YitT family COG1284 [Pseudobacteriovorax antillogorgiicola]